MFLFYNLLQILLLYLTLGVLITLLLYLLTLPHGGSFPHHCALSCKNVPPKTVLQLFLL